MPLTRRVFLLVDAAHGYDRRVLSGVGHYAQFIRGWVFRTYAPWEVDLIRTLMESWHPSGVISCARVWDKTLFGLFENTGIPLVQADWIDRDFATAQVYTDGDAVAQMVADYYIERGLRSFGYVGGTGAEDRRQQEAMRNAVLRRGFAFASFTGEIRTENDPTREFHRWLHERPRPAGILASTDWVGWHVTSACVDAGYRVPDEFSVMGISDDRPWCELAPIPLSSVSIAAEKIGYQAASLLDQAMKGKSIPREPIHLPPVGIVARWSTDIIATEDPDMSVVLRHIHDHAAEGISVKQLLRHVPMDRRRLERWFRQNLGRSPLEEIQRLRIAHVQKLMAETEEPMEEIAHRCGFANAKLLARVFRRETGMTLMAYRRQFRRALGDTVGLRTEFEP